MTKMQMRNLRLLFTDGFKYLKKAGNPYRNGCQYGFSTNMECSNKSIHYGYIGSHYLGANKPFFISPHTERKADLTAHHDFLVKNVFQEWTKLEVKLSNKKDSLYVTVVPLYLDIIDKIDSIDQYKEALSHLQDKRYSESLSIYNKMKELQASHNEKVSQFMEKNEIQIKDAIWNDNEIHLRDVNFLKTIYTEIDFLKKSIEKGEFGSLDYEATRMGALNDSIGVYYNNLFDHLLRQAIDHRQGILQVESLQQDKNPWFFPTLFRSDSREKIIAKGVPASKSIAHLKNLIENKFESQEILVPLKEFQFEIDEMKKLFSKFTQNIQQITHDYHALKLRGKCRIESQINLFDRLFHRGG